MFFLCVSFKIWLPDLFFRELKQPWCLAHASVHCPAYSTNQTELLSPTPGVAGMPSVEPLCQGCPGAVTVTHGRYPTTTTTTTTSADTELFSEPGGTSRTLKSWLEERFSQIFTDPFKT